VGYKAIFAPCKTHNVGIYNVNTGSFSSVATPSQMGSSATSCKTEGGAAVGTKVYFAPSHQAYAGVFDTATSSFTAIATPYTTAPAVSMGMMMESLYGGAVAHGTKVRILVAPPKAKCTPLPCH